MLLLLFISKSPGCYAIYPRNNRVLEMQNFTPAYVSGVDVRAKDRFSQNQNFLDAWITEFSYPWCSAARELRFNHHNKWQCSIKLVILSEKSIVSGHRSKVPMRKPSQGLFWPCVAGVKKWRGGRDVRKSNTPLLTPSSSTLFKACHACSGQGC